MKYFVSLFNFFICFLLIFKYSQKNILEKSRQYKFNKSIITKYIKTRTLTENYKPCDIKYMNTSIFSGNKNPQKREKKLKAKKKELKEKKKDNIKEDNNNNKENETEKNMKNNMENNMEDHVDDHVDDVLEHHNSLEDIIKEYYEFTDPSIDEENKSFFKKLKF
ncbi:exported protein (hyp4, exported protein family 3), partial [Plasmodium gaboni]